MSDIKLIGYDYDGEEYQYIAIDPTTKALLVKDLNGGGVSTHDELTGVTANQHHAQAHSLASHSTKAHSELTGVIANQHHAQVHSLASHSTKAHSELTGVTGSQHHTDPKEQAKARAYQSSAQSIVTDTDTKVNLQTETYDVGDNFASSRFTAPKTGFYLCIGQVGLLNIIDEKYVAAKLYKNGAEIVHNFIWAPRTTEAAGLWSNLSDIVYLVATNYVELYTRHSMGANRNLLANSEDTFLSVCLLSEL